MRIGHQAGQARQQFLIIERVVRVLAQSIAQDRLASADPAEHFQRAQIAFQREQEYFLVIAHQEAGFGQRLGHRHRGFDDARRIGAAIDQIAQKDDLLLGGPARRIIGLDQFDQLVEQVAPAVNDTDRIGALPVGNAGPGRPRCRFFEKFEHRPLNHTRYLAAASWAPGWRCRRIFALPISG